MRHVLFFITILLLLSSCSSPTSTPVPTTSTPVPPTETSMPPTSSPRPTTPTPVQLTETSMPPTPTAITLRRGVNFGNMLEAPNEGDWGLRVQQEYFDLVKEAGFDFVRLPVKWSAHAGQEAPYTIDPAFFARIDEIIDWALQRDLAIIIDIHHYGEIMPDPWGNKDRYLGLWKQIAEHYKDFPSNVLFELLNEPNDQLNAQLWNEYLAESLAIVRETNPTRDVVIGPVFWNSHEWLSTLDVPNDEHLIVTFHYYLPFQFTHQGAEWMGSESQNWLGKTWDATDAEKAEITAHFDSVADWAQRHGNVRILLGEFGAYSKAPQDSRVRWTEFVAREAERHGFAWAYWELASGFGVYDPNAHQWRNDLLKALIP